MDAGIAEDSDVETLEDCRRRRLDVRPLFEDHQCIGDEPVAGGGRFQRLLAEALCIGRIGEDEMERLHRADGAEVRRVTPENLRPSLQAERLDVRLQQSPALDALLDEECLTAPP